MDDIKYLQEDEIPNELLCCICACPFIHPLVHSKCGNTFCKKCIDRLADCPICRSRIIGCVTEAPKMVHSLLDKLKVVCPSCGNEVGRGVLSDHMGKCPVLCPHGCGVKIIPRNLSAHDSECGEKIIACSAQRIGCQTKIKKNLLELHESTCKLAIIQPYFEENQQLHTEKKILLDNNKKLLEEKQKLHRDNKNLTDEIAKVKMQIGQQKSVVCGNIQIVNRPDSTYRPPYIHTGVSQSSITSYHPPYI